MMGQAMSSKDSPIRSLQAWSSSEENTHSLSNPSSYQLLGHNSSIASSDYGESAFTCGTKTCPPSYHS